MKKQILTIILVFFTLFVFSEEQPLAPYVSRIKIAVKGPKIKLTWQDPSEEFAQILVYRNTEEINNENFSSSVKVGNLAPGAEYFIDTPPAKVDFYYALLVLDKDGTLHKVFIAFRNKTNSGVSVVSALTEIENAVVISEIKATVKGDGVLVQFKSSRKNRDLILYRSTRQIKDITTLTEASFLTGFKSAQTSYNDYPIAGIPYFYAVLDAKLVELGQLQLSPGQNSTENPVQIPLDKSRLDSEEISRPSPLPLLSLSREIESGQSLPQNEISSGIQVKTLSPDTQRIVAELLQSISLKEPQLPSPTVLDADKTAEGGGEEYTLSKIIEDYFLARDWLGAETHLINFLQLHHSQEVETRAHFYLAQTYGFQGKHKKAFLEMIMVVNDYYLKSKPWMDYLYSVLEKEGN